MVSNLCLLQARTSHALLQLQGLQENAPQGATPAQKQKATPESVDRDLHAHVSMQAGRPPATPDAISCFETQPVVRTLSPKTLRGSPMGSQKPLSPVQAAVMRQQDPPDTLGSSPPQPSLMTGSNFYSHKRGPGTHFSLQLNDGDPAGEGQPSPFARLRVHGCPSGTWGRSQQVRSSRAFSPPGQPQRTFLCHEWVLGCTSTRLSDRLPQLLVNFSVCYM